jgi:hypothetical protein
MADMGECVLHLRDRIGEHKAAVTVQCRRGVVAYSNVLEHNLHALV